MLPHNNSLLLSPIASGAETSENDTAEKSLHEFERFVSLSGSRGARVTANASQRGAQGGKIDEGCYAMLAC